MRVITTLEASRKAGTIAILVWSLAAALPTIASAKDVTERVMEACKADYKKFCPSYSVNTPELNDCMTQAGKRKSLSPKCLDALIDDGFVPRKYR